MAPPPTFNLGDFSISGKAQLLRYEYAEEGENPLRISHIMDTSEVKNGKVQTTTLLSLGDFRFVRMVIVDGSVNRRDEILITGRGHMAKFSRAADPDLAEGERGGLFTIDRTALKIIPTESTTATVRRRINTALEAWDPAELEALRALYVSMTSCGAAVPKATLLPMLLGDKRRKCSRALVQTAPDPKRDQSFVPLSPELGEWIKAPAKAMKGPGR